MNSAEFWQSLVTYAAVQFNENGQVSDACTESNVPFDKL